MGGVTYLKLRHPGFLFERPIHVSTGVSVLLPDFWESLGPTGYPGGGHPFLTWGMPPPCKIEPVPDRCRAAARDGSVPPTSVKGRYVSFFYVKMVVWFFFRQKISDILFLTVNTYTQ